MLGSIIGDIVGSIYEWNNIKTKQFDLFNKGCRPTDDTILTICVARALLKSNGDYSKLGEFTIDSMKEIGRNYPNCGYGGHFRSWLYGDNQEPYNSYGNGSAMRISPVGFAATSIDEVKELSNIITGISHNHPEGFKGAEATAVAIYMARTNHSKEEIKQYINENYYKVDFSLDEIRPHYSFDVSCQGSVPQALEAFFESNDFEDAIRNAISIGGDSDTIAAITGGIASAYYGIPNSIRNQALDYMNDELKQVLFEFENKYEGKTITLKNTL